ncbi:MAG: Flp pilus assembly protein CpaB [Candidatus Binatia bacterium]
MPNRLKIAIFVAIFFGFIAAYGIYNFLQKERQARKELEFTTQDVVVASREIPSGTAITNEMVKVTRFTKTSVPSGSFSSPKQVVGKTVKVKAVAGDPITEPKLTGEGAGLTVLLTPGHRAMAVRVDEIIGVSGFISPNDRVDVIATVVPPGGPQDQKLSKIVLQYKRVLSVAQALEQKDGKPQLARSITLEVTPEEAEKLSLASIEGTIVLVLRASGDENVTQTRGSTKRELLAIAAPQRGGKPVPLAAPPQKYRVEVYQGSEKSVQEF